MLRKTLLVTTALVLGASVAYAGTHKVSSLKDMPKQIHPKFLNLGLVGHLNKDGMAAIALGTGKTNTHPIGHNTLHGLKDPKSGYSNFSKSANAQWISWYGFTAINDSSCYEYSSNYYYCFVESGNNALPFTAKGTATAITVPLFSETGSGTEYNVGIYSGTASGGPGASELAGGSFSGASDSEYCCNNSRTVNVSFKFNKKAQYYAELKCGSNTGECYGGWDMEDVDFSGATVDWWHVYEFETEYYYGSQYTYTYSSPWHESLYYPTAGAISIN